jgi:hypothetical protein
MYITNTADTAMVEPSTVSTTHGIAPKYTPFVALIPFRAIDVTMFVLPPPTKSIR